MLLMKLQVKQIRRGKNIRIMNLKDLLLQMTISEKKSEQNNLLQLFYYNRTNNNKKISAEHRYIEIVIIQRTHRSAETNPEVHKLKEYQSNNKIKNTYTFTKRPQSTS